MTELYTLLIDITSRENQNKLSGGIYKSIMNRVYTQLNDYGKNIIDKHCKQVSYENVETEFITEEELHKRDNFSMLMSALKSGARIKVEFKCEGKTYFETVSIRSNNGKLLLTDEKRNKYIVEYDDIIGIVEIIDFH